MARKSQKGLAEKKKVIRTFCNLYGLDYKFFEPKDIDEADGLIKAFNNQDADYLSEHLDKVEKRNAG